MYDLYDYRDDLTVKKKFDYVLDFLAYIAKVDTIATPSAPEDIFDRMLCLGSQYIKEPINFDLLDLYYELKIGVYARPKLKQKNVVSKYIKSINKPLILVQHNNIRAGDAALITKNFYPDKDIIHYGFCHSITEYHIMLICSKIFNIDLYVLCIDKNLISKMDPKTIFDLNQRHVNQWKKPAKKEIRTA